MIRITALFTALLLYAFAGTADAQCATCFPAGSEIPSCQRGPLQAQYAIATDCSGDGDSCTMYPPFPCGGMFAQNGAEYLPTIFGSPSGHVNAGTLIGDGSEVFKTCSGIVFDVQYTETRAVEIRAALNRIEI